MSRASDDDLADIFLPDVAATLDGIKNTPRGGGSPDASVLDGIPAIEILKSGRRK